ncbi:MAG: TonB family protein [Terriglobales bacterium]
MRNPLRFRPDPPDYSLLARINQQLGGENPEPPPATSVSQLARKLSIVGSASSADLALDIVLHDVAEQIRLTVAATGVAIALTRSGELVCRAATGSAPDLGVRLNPHSGLSGLCLHTRTPQRCDDTEMDHRVDLAACRDLRIRSILMAPVITENGDVAALVEVFAAAPGHFRDRDVEILLSFCRRIVNDLNDAAEVASTSLVESHPAQKPISDRGSVDSGSVDSKSGVSRSGMWDRGTMFLTIAVIALAVVLGWMIGLAGRRKVASREPENNSRQISQDRALQNQTAAPVASDGPSPRGIPQRTPSAELPVTPKSAEAENPPGGLVVYQNGKVVFREFPKQRVPGQKTTAATGSRRIREPIIPAGKTEILSTDAANQYVTYRVSPFYPELARKQHVQGPVQLKVLVGKDGSVQQVQVLTGEPNLAAAAADAVVQWRFKPVLRGGQPVEFETDVTVNFKLP